MAQKLNAPSVFSHGSRASWPIYRPLHVFVSQSLSLSASPSLSPSLSLSLSHSLSLSVCLCLCLCFSLSVCVVFREASEAVQCVLVEFRWLNSSMHFIEETWYTNAVSSLIHLFLCICSILLPFLSISSTANEFNSEGQKVFVFHAWPCCVANGLMWD